MSRKQTFRQDNSFRFEYQNYIQIKEWLQATKRNQPPPSIEPSNKVSANQELLRPINYVFSFKKILLEDQYISRNLRFLNLMANNGMVIMATIYDQNKGCYIGRAYEKKGIYCTWDANEGSIACLQDNILGFYIMQHKNLNKFGQYLRIRIQLVTNEGSISEVGIIQYDLSLRPKHSLSDLDLLKNGAKVGCSQFIIDTSESMALQEFLHPYFFISEGQNLPPCKRIDLLHKVEPLIVSQPYPLLISNFTISINNYSLFEQKLRKESPFFMEHHHDCITLEISKFVLIVGYHNSWKFIEGIGRVKDRIKEQASGKKVKIIGDRSKPSMSKSPSKGNSPQKYNNESQTIQQNRIKNAQFLHKIIMTGQKNPQHDSMELSIPQPYSLTHFQSECGHLAAILKITISFSLKATTISEKKDKQVCVFWAPIVFNRSEIKTTVHDSAMIDHIGFPGFMPAYPFGPNASQHIASLSQYKQNGAITAKMGYQCVNENPDLHKMHRKQQKIKSLIDIGPSVSSKTINNAQNSNPLFDKLLQELQEGDTTPKVTTTQIKSKKTIKLSEGADHHLDHQIEHKVRLVNHLLKRQLSKLRPSGQQIAIPQNIIVPSLISNPDDPPSDLLGKLTSILDKPQIFRSLHVKIGVTAYLAHTTNPSAYYIPRKLQIQIHGLRRHKKQTLCINKQSAKYGVPIQLHKTTESISHSLDAVTLDVRLEDIDESQFQLLLDSQIVFMVHDLQNHQYYAMGRFPARQMLTSAQQLTQHSRVQLIHHSSHTYGSLLVTTHCTILQQTQHKPGPSRQTPTISAQEVSLNDIMRELPLRERMKLRVNNYNKKDQDISLELIQQYKHKKQNTYIKNIVNLEFNNDLQFDYEVGKECLQWLPFVNEDSSNNNLFAFEIVGTEFVEIVVDKGLYEQAALRSGQKKNYIAMAYVLGNQLTGERGHYSAKIPSKIQYHILVRQLHLQWKPNMQPTRIVSMVVKRNTMPYKQFKIRLNLHAPLLDDIRYIPILTTSSLSHDVRIPFPEQLISRYGENVIALSRAVTYLKKQRQLVVSLYEGSGTVQMQELIPEIGLNQTVLIGFYSDNSCQKLHKTVLLSLQIMMGEQISTNVGQLYSLSIPMSGNQHTFANRLYFMDINQQGYQVKVTDSANLKYLPKPRSEPEIDLRSLRPGTKELIISVLNVDRQLLRKYMVRMHCKAPTNCIYEEILVEGYSGQKFYLILRNPYLIDYGFRISATSPNIIFHNLPFEQDSKGLIKISANSIVKVPTQLADNYYNQCQPQDNGKHSRQQFVIVTDLAEHVVMVFKLAIFGDGESKKTSYKGSYRNSARGVAGAHKMGF